MIRQISTLIVAAAVLVPAAGAHAASPLRCNRTHGSELAHSTSVKVYKVKQAKSTYRYYGCARPRGPVAPLTKTFKGSQVKLVAAKGAYVAFTRTIHGQDTISVVDARTARQHHGLYPPYDIEFDTDPATPQIGAARLNTRGELAVSYVGLGDGSSTDSTTYIYAFDTAGDEQLLDSGPSAKLPPRSIHLSGETVRWTHDAVTRKATIGEVSLNVTGGGGLMSGDVTTSPEGGIACHVTQTSLAGTCVGSFAPSTRVRVVATGPANSTVSIGGGCSAVHAPVAGQSTSVATCLVSLSRARTVKVTFG